MENVNDAKASDHSNANRSKNKLIVAIVAGTLIVAGTMTLAFYVGFVLYHWGMLGGPPLRQNRLFTAVWNNDTNEVVQLIEQGADPNGASIMLTRPTPLIDATRFGNSGIVRVLLEKGADPNRTDRFGHAALYHALISPSLQETNQTYYFHEIITNLLAHNASISQTDVMKVITNMDARDPRFLIFQDAMTNKQKGGL